MRIKMARGAWKLKWYQKIWFWLWQKYIYHKNKNKFYNVVRDEFCALSEKQIKWLAENKQSLKSYGIRTKNTP